MVDGGDASAEQHVDDTVDVERPPAAGDPVGGPVFRSAGASHVGGVRELNEDSWVASDRVCVVADGMGGHDAGEVASGVAVQLVSEVFGSRDLDLAELPVFVSELNSAVRRRAAEDDTSGMGTTLVGVAAVQNGASSSAVVFHVGDSRCYRLHDGVMTQLTSDHSHVQQLVELGRITPEDAANHPLRNVITRALGADADVQPDLRVLEDVDCRLLLCSDGLSGELDDEQIAEILRSQFSAEDAARRLVEVTLEGPARDNVTAVVVDVHFPDAPTDENTDVRAVVARLDDTVEGDAAGSPSVDVTVQPGT